LERRHLLDLHCNKNIQRGKLCNQIAEYCANKFLLGKELAQKNRQGICIPLGIELV
jgi:hypothetical protein